MKTKKRQIRFKHIGRVSRITGINRQTLHNVLTGRTQQALFAHARALSECLDTDIEVWLNPERIPDRAAYMQMYEMRIELSQRKKRRNPVQKSVSVGAEAVA